MELVKADRRRLVAGVVQTSTLIEIVSHGLTQCHIARRPADARSTFRQGVSSDAMPDSLLNLNCWVHGDELQNVFPVKIARDETVGALKKAIKEEKKPLFDHIPADSLELWKVSNSDRCVLLQ